MPRASVLAMVSRFSGLSLSLVTGIIVGCTLGAKGKGTLACLTFARFHLVPTPAADNFYAREHGPAASPRRSLLHDYLGILEYWRRGWI